MSKNEPMTPEQKAQDLRDAMREANVFLADLKATVKLAEKVRDDIAAYVDGEEVSKRIDAAVILELSKMNKRIKEAMDSSVAKVTSEFDKLRDILMGEAPDDKRAGRESIPSLIKKRAAAGRKK